MNAEITTSVSFFGSIEDVSMIIISITVPGGGSGLIENLVIRQCCEIGK